MKSLEQNTLPKIRGIYYAKYLGDGGGGMVAEKKIKINLLGKKEKGGREKVENCKKKAQNNLKSYFWGY